MNKIIFVFLLGLATHTYSAEPMLICSVNKPVARIGDAVHLKVLTKGLSATARLQWSVSAGNIESEESVATWKIPGRPGLHKATLSVRDAAGSQLNCQVKVFAVSELRSTSNETGRGFLARDETEKPGFGLYSYFLLGSPPDEKSRDRYLKAIDTYLRLTPALAELNALLDRDELNANYMPVNRSPENGATAQWVLTHYDYVRARTLLRNLPGSLRRGPYLVSSLNPAGDGRGFSGPLLFQDLSSVPAHLVPNWYEEFLNQAAQERFWDTRHAQRFVLRMRTIIGILALGLPDVEKALEHWITWLR